MKLFSYFADNNQGADERLTRMLASPAASLLDGISFAVDPLGGFNEIEAMAQRENVPQNFILGFALQPQAGEDFLSMCKRVCDNQSLFTLLYFLTSRAKRLQTQLAASGITPFSINFSPCLGQFHVTGNLTDLADAGITPVSFTNFLTSYLNYLSILFPTSFFHLPYQNPYNNWFGPLGQGDAGKSYLALEATLVAVTPRYINFNQTFKAPKDRAICLEAAKGRPYAGMAATGLSESEVLATLSLAESEGMLWLELQDNQVQYIPSAAPQEIAVP